MLNSIRKNLILLVIFILITVAVCSCGYGQNTVSEDVQHKENWDWVHFIDIGYQTENISILIMNDSTTDKKSVYYEINDEVVLDYVDISEDTYNNILSLTINYVNNMSYTEQSGDLDTLELWKLSILEDLDHKGKYKSFGGEKIPDDFVKYIHNVIDILEKA